MALLKTTNVTGGYAAEYWKVLETNINFHEKRAHVTIGLFKDQAARDGGEAPVLTKGYDWSGNEFVFNMVKVETTDPETGITTTNPNLVDDNPVSLVYRELKKDEFKDAMDV